MLTEERTIELKSRPTGDNSTIGDLANRKTRYNDYIHTICIKRVYIMCTCVYVSLRERERERVRCV